MVTFDLQVITHHQAPNYVNNFFKIQKFSSGSLILWVFIEFTNTDKSHVRNAPSSISKARKDTNSILKHIKKGT
jgi:hypothetical protein